MKQVKKEKQSGANNELKPKNLLGKMCFPKISLQIIPVKESQVPTAIWAIRRVQQKKSG